MHSLRSQIKRYSLITFALAIGGVLLISDQVLQRITQHYITTRLQHDADSLVAALSLQNTQWVLAGRPMATVYDRVFSGHYYVVFDSNTQVRSRSLWDYAPHLESVAPGKTASYQTDGPNQQRWLVFTQGISKAEKSVTIWVAEDITPILQTQQQYRWMVLGLLALALLVLLWLQQRLLGKAFARLDPIRTHLHNMRLGEEDKELQDMPSEIQPLVDEIGRLLEQLGQRVSRSRNALGNLAHEMKRTLQRLQLTIEQVPEQQRAEAQSALNELQRLVERELKRARIAGSSSPGRHTVLSKELPPLKEIMEKLYPHCHIQLHYADGLILPQDRDDMLELLGNLLDNACRYGASNIQVFIKEEHDRYQLRVMDDGPGIPGDKLEQLKDRGQRLDEHIEGSGLGLSICEDIVRLYSGLMTFKPLSPGLEIEILIPSK
ncbi:MAG: histidine kinase [Pseudomonadales bacterium]|nr:histidine kinase [Pseudomonadales bacterium]RLU04134.1 MAG: sensor histidine kinase [Ketobacter sp.]